MPKRLVLLLPGRIAAKGIIAHLREDDYIIAVDGGIRQAKVLGVTPRLWVGDFDSATPQERVDYGHIPQEVHPQDKDKLDTELALSKIDDLATQECLIIGGFGGRIDHQLALFQFPLAHPHIEFTHTDGMVWMYRVAPNKQYTVAATLGTILSIIPLCAMTGVYLVGVKWPLINATLREGQGYAVSNRVTQAAIDLTVTTGIGWLIISPKE